MLLDDGDDGNDADNDNDNNNTINIFEGHPKYYAPRHRKVKKFTHGLMTNKWWGQALNPGSLAPESLLLTTIRQ